MRERLFGGSQFVDLGRIAIDAPQPAQPPAPAFGAQDLNRIRQGTIAAGYALSWRGGVGLNLGLQKTDYRQRTVPGNGAALVGRASPLLLTATGSVRLAESLSAYASYAEGLEDSGAAPGSATNRNAPLPASRTRQYDIGMRWKVKPGLSLIVGAYDLSRPYFQFDPQGAFSQLGSTGNRGFEVSLSGAITPPLDVVGGVIVDYSKVCGPAVEAGLVGNEPVRRPDRRFNLAFGSGIYGFIDARAMQFSLGINF